ncbi:hypothetical protein JW905_15625 [bacterium]|nr:hypothetical protein [candidate division CSSED10-310 bacterium]
MKVSCILSMVFFIAASCTVSAALQEELRWDGSPVLPTYNQVMAMPIVAPLGPAPGTPAVIFSTWSTSTGYTDYGVLRAIDGTTGSELWTVTTASNHVQPAGGIAAGDIDNDGRIEIIAPGAPIIGNGTLCFEDDGGFKWHSAYPTSAAALRTCSIADIDQDGSPEIICGKCVLNANGSLMWEGSGTAGASMAVAADLDMNGGMEIIEGAYIYDTDASIKWSLNPAIPGIPAIADLVGGPGSEPELVVSYLDALYLFTYNGSLIWGPVSHPGGSYAAPCIADFDGDNEAEIAISGKTNIGVYESGGAVKWLMPVNDSSSGRCGCSAHDLDGDGACELVSQDQSHLRIYDGATGAVRHQVSLGSGTLIEYPVVADVDMDGEVEIVAACNNYAFGSETGIRVFSPVSETWTAGRSTWNQYCYHITNVNENGGVPPAEPSHWLYANSFRAQAAFSPTPIPSPTGTPWPTPTEPPTATTSPEPSRTPSPSPEPTATPSITTTPSPTIPPTPPVIPSSGAAGAAFMLCMLTILLTSRHHAVNPECPGNGDGKRL